jgi:hypothetical protein
LRGYDDLPRWVKEGDEPDAALRDEVVSTTASTYDSSKTLSAADRLDAAAGSSSRTPDSIMSPRSLNGVGEAGTGAAVGKGKEKTLDDWLAEESGSEEETDEEEEDGEEETDEEESEYETESESGEEGNRLVK